MRAKNRGHGPLPHYCADDRYRLSAALAYPLRLAQAPSSFISTRS
ncbi:hypothetical protein M2262_004685 [Pseudomonas sp. BIGb0408]|uniref:Uncharacterized protein n=1 Tax=Phytopseudomonas flavescens TaxID=29435 RepID=A0A7Y9XRA4_9GAMM|nr:hypothetical protein [Pseudomonas sp. BIGb0408]NYH76091.1 hypothetical protein [Pseudomonas flavescens]